MAEITKETVEHVAHLARLSLSQKETEMYRKDLEKILLHIRELEKVDTEGVQEFLSPVRENESFYVDDSFLRADEIKESLSTEDVLKNAPDSAYNQFKLEAIIDSES